MSVGGGSKILDVRTVPMFKMHNVGTQVFDDFFCLNLDFMKKINDRSLHPLFDLSRQVSFPASSPSLQSDG